MKPRPKAPFDVCPGEAKDTKEMCEPKLWDHFIPRTNVIDTRFRSEETHNK